MSNGDLLDIQPAQLMFPFKLRKQSSCCLQLTNKTDEYVAFKIKSSSNKKKYGALPNTGIVLPRTACYVTVTMRAQKEAPKDMQCKDKFVLQSVTAPSGATEKDITREMFKKESGKVVKEFKLRAFYVPANPLVPEGSAPRASVVENGSQGTSLFDAASNSLLMSMSSILSIQPTELKFPFELKNPSSCSLQLTNKSDEYVPPAPEGSSPRARLMENESQGTSVFDAVHGFFSSHFQWKKRNNPLTTPLLTSNRDGR